MGYPVEFLSIEEIRDIFGTKGITEYSISGRYALISDDTQMTLFTAAGLLQGVTRGRIRGVSAPFSMYVFTAYGDWLKTQSERFPLQNDVIHSWLMNQKRSFSQRAPGNTCISALSSGAAGTIENPINDSKGCGGVMRVAPIGLFMRGDRSYHSDPGLEAAKVAALTHGHELGYIPAAALSYIIYEIVHKHQDINLAIDAAMKATMNLFSGSTYMDSFMSLVDKAQHLAEKNLDDNEAIESIGAGWVAEEALAVAIYCALKYQDDFERAVVAAANHSGDSDSTGAITGNIVGAYVGMQGIPIKFLESLELKKVLLEVAEDLYFDCPVSEFNQKNDRHWVEKYVNFSYMVS